MGSLDRIAKRIALYRACLQRDAELGVIPAAGRAPVDDCLATIEHVLEAARVELEGAGTAEAEDADSRRLAARCGTMAARLFGGMYRERETTNLAACATALEREARKLHENP